jgi:hypothetical protein
LWYRASREAQLSASPVADEAEMWLILRECVAHFDCLMHPSLHRESSIGAGYVLVTDPHLAKVTRHVVEANPSLQEMLHTARSMGCIPDKDAVLVYTLQGAVDSGYEALQELLAANRQHMQSAEGNTDAGTARYESLWARWVLLDCGGSVELHSTA